MLRSVFALMLGVCVPLNAHAGIISAELVNPTDAYGHGAVAQGEYAVLRIKADGQVYDVKAQNGVFEDTHARLTDITGDGNPEVIVVRADFNLGAEITVWGQIDDQVRQIGSYGPIGTRNRWWAVVGVADFDRDNILELAFVDRPHLAKTLTVLEIGLQGDEVVFSPKAKIEGLSNHRYGANIIEGGVRDCGAAPEIITANGDWTRMVATFFNDGQWLQSDIGTYTGPDALTERLQC